MPSPARHCAVCMRSCTFAEWEKCVALSGTTSMCPAKFTDLVAPRERELPPPHGDDLDDDSPCPYGRQHRDEPMKEVPASYLLWAWDFGGLWRENGPVSRYIRSRMAALLKSEPEYILEHPVK